MMKLRVIIESLFSGIIFSSSFDSYEAARKFLLVDLEMSQHKTFEQGFISRSENGYVHDAVAWIYHYELEYPERYTNPLFDAYVQRRIEELGKIKYA